MATLSQQPAAKVPAGSAPEPLPIQLDRLSHNYGDRLALDNLSFAVQPAEIFGLLGPNGSGKTTLFRILSTLMVPSGGTARIQGFDVAREPNQARQQTGIVFQARSLDIKLTVAENLKHQGHLYGLRGETLKHRSEEVLRRVGLSTGPGIMSKPFPAVCSGGSNWPRASSIPRQCCCWTSRPPVSILARAATCGSTCAHCATRKAFLSW